MAEERKGSESGGLECPVCGCYESIVVYTRERSLKINGKRKGAIVRSRECQNDRCKHRFITSERLRDEGEYKPPK